MKNHLILKLTALILVTVSLPFAVLGCGDGKNHRTETPLPTPELIEGSNFELTNRQKELAAEIIKNLYGAEPIDLISASETKLFELYLYNLYSATLEEYENGYGRITCEEANEVSELVFGYIIFFNTRKAEPLPDIYTDDGYYYIKLSDAVLPEVTVNSISRAENTIVPGLTETVFAVNISRPNEDGTGEVRLTVNLLPKDNENGFIVRSISSRAEG